MVKLRESTLLPQVTDWRDIYWIFESVEYFLKESLNYTGLPY